ncbi:uncharacterized protein LOC110907459 [Helianthus annuus]|uniref:uncharacterized protein LOC110907459 n=1 Tax=Helianthus annuus TaxID=4232 RepID=UPI000B908BB9|nr:uncharacterized protein LOC110907459 [Helianthus annuus]
MVSDCGISFLSLQELKATNVSHRDFAKFWGNKNFGLDYVDSVGQSGGLICAWDDKVFCQSGGSKNRYYLHVRGSLLGCASPVNVLNVYAPQGLSAKKSLWEELKMVIDSFDGLWVISGDFNVVRFREEKRNCAFKQNCANNFNDFIFESGLIEYNMRGRMFTFRSDNGNKLSKLDRFLVNSEFFSAWPAASCRVLPRDRLKEWKEIMIKKEGEEVMAAKEENEKLEDVLDSRDFSEEEEWIFHENKKIICEA